MRNNRSLLILRTVFLIAVSLVLGVNIYSWNVRSLTGNVLPMPFGCGAAVVLSGSMEPAIMTDDLIVVRAEENYSVGDVVVYQSGKVLVVHRIVNIQDDMVITQGDANNIEDAPIEVAQIKGKVIAEVPRVGLVIRLLKTPAATVLMIAAAVLSIELPYRKEKEEKEEELERIKEEIRRLKEEQKD